MGSVWDHIFQVLYTWNLFGVVCHELLNIVHFLPTSRHLHPLQAATSCRNSRLVVDECDNSGLKG